MNLPCARRVCFQSSRYAVIETHTKSKDKIGVLNSQIRMHFPMHPHHSQAQGMGGWECAKSQQGTCDGRIGLDRKVH